MSNKHKHYDLIVAWAEGKQIQYYNAGCSNWHDIEHPNWGENTQYRIKPESKPDIRVKLWRHDKGFRFHLTFVFDGNTKAFKTVEYHDE